MPGPNNPRKRVKPRHPAYAGRPKGAWYPDLVGVVQGYPPTLEVWQAKSDAMRAQVIRLNAEGKMQRLGIPDGWAGRKKEAHAARAKAHEEAPKEVRDMIDKSIYELPTGTDGERAEVALIYATAVVRDPTAQSRDRLAAARLLADFTKIKPATASTVVVSAAEAFLNSLIPHD